MARVLKNKLLSRARDHAVKQSGVCVTEVYSDASTNRVTVCNIHNTCSLTVSNYYIGQRGRTSQSHQPTACDFLLWGWATEKSLVIKTKEHSID